MDPYPSSPGLWRLSAAAKVVGMSPDTLARGCESGEIPIALVRIGPRLRFVKAAELSAYLASRPAEPDLLAWPPARLSKPFSNPQ